MRHQLLERIGGDAQMIIVPIERSQLRQMDMNGLAALPASADPLDIIQEAKLLGSIQIGAR